MVKACISLETVQYRIVLVRSSVCKATRASSLASPRADNTSMRSLLAGAAVSISDQHHPTAQDECQEHQRPRLCWESLRVRRFMAL